MFQEIIKKNLRDCGWDNNISNKHDYFLLNFGAKLKAKFKSKIADCLYVLSDFFTTFYKAGGFNLFNLLSLKVIKRFKLEEGRNRRNLNEMEWRKDVLLYFDSNEMNLAECGLYIQWRIISQLARETSHLNTWEGSRELTEVQNRYMKMLRVGNFDQQDEGLILNIMLLFSKQYFDAVEDISRDYQKEFERLWREL